MPAAPPTPSRSPSGDRTRRRSGLPDTALGAAVRQRERLWRVAFGVALVVQLIAVYAPSGVGGPEITGLDKVVHVLIFAAPVLTGLKAGIDARWVLGALALHAPVSELIQHFALPHRDGDVFDALADLGGVTLGALATVVWSRRQH